MREKQPAGAPPPRSSTLRLLQERQRTPAAEQLPPRAARAAEHGGRADAVEHHGRQRLRLRVLARARSQHHAAKLSRQRGVRLQRPRAHRRDRRVLALQPRTPRRKYVCALLLRQGPVTDVRAEVLAQSVPRGRRGRVADARGLVQVGTGTTPGATWTRDHAARRTVDGEHRGVPDHATRARRERRGQRRGFTERPRVSDEHHLPQLFHTDAELALRGVVPVQGSVRRAVRSRGFEHGARGALGRRVRGRRGVGVDEVRPIPSPMILRSLGRRELLF